MSFEPVIDDKQIVGENITVDGINNSHHKHRLCHDGLAMNLSLSDVHYSLCVMLIALLIAEELNYSVHSPSLLVYEGKDTNNSLIDE